MTLVGLSATMLYTAFGLYSIATIIFGLAIKGKDKKSKNDVTGKVAIWITIAGLAAQITYFITRWIAGGHAPLSNLFKFMIFLGMCLVLAFIIIYFIYRLIVFELFVVLFVFIFFD